LTLNKAILYNVNANNLQKGAIHMKRILTLVLIVVCCTMLWGCNADGGNEVKEGKMQVFTSFYPMYFLTKEIAGDRAEVVNITPAGAEPHDWEPTPKLMAQIQKASMLVYNGAGMETWIETIKKNIDSNSTRLVEASAGIELIRAEEHEDEEEHEHEEEGYNHGDYDPHVWVSPVRAIQQGENILKALIELDPANEEYYKENYNSLKSRLEKLDGDLKKAREGFRSNVIVVSHEAFGYLARDYGLKQVAIRGVNPDDEPSPSKMAELVEECREHNVKYVFFEKLTNPKLSETLAREIGAGTLVLNDAAGLTQQDIDQGKDYISVMYENIENLKKALSE